MIRTTRRALPMILAAVVGGATVYAGPPVGASTARDTAIVVGHARFAGDDYPYETLGQFEHSEGVDPWNEFFGQCDSFAAWKVYENLGGTARPDPDQVPQAGFHPADAGRSPVWGTAGPTGGRADWGDARDWSAAAKAAGYQVDGVPRPGSIAWWSDQGTGMSVGHVGYVTDVYADGSVTIEGYNLRVNGQYSTIHMGPSGADDTSFHLSPWHVVWPTGFIHIGDGPSVVSGPPQPAPAPGFHYARNVTGPGDGSGYSLGGPAWVERLGSGELGDLRWAQNTADSTATWVRSLRPGGCYSIAAFVPDVFSNTQAQYTVQGATGRTAVVDENAFTDQWAPLGTFTADPAGALRVTLTNQGPSDHYVAADAMRFVLDPTCS